MDQQPDRSSIQPHHITQDGASYERINGYRKLTVTELADINGAKDLGQRLGDYIRRLEANDPHVDKRWLAIAKTDLQKGIMELVRAIARPNSF